MIKASVDRHCKSAQRKNRERSNNKRNIIDLIQQKIN